MLRSILHLSTVLEFRTLNRPALLWLFNGCLLGNIWCLFNTLRVFRRA